MLFYSVRHVTRFRYSAPISESMMEVHMQPRGEGAQRLHSFHLATNPRAHLMSYGDELANTIHHFDIPDRHAELSLTARALVELHPPQPLPEALDAAAWTELDALTATDEYWDTLEPSRFARPSALLHELAQELDVRRGDDPLTTLRDLTAKLYHALEYVPRSTRADSPIDDALRDRRGVCQDYTHIMIALVRGLCIPCRYVSGYLYHRGGGLDRSSAGATHAWIEALLPRLGWVGFDPTNNLVVGDRHIRVAIGRDYDDVPPTHGVFKGHADSELSVAVQVSLSSPPAPGQDPLPPMEWQPLESGGQQ